MLTDQWTAFHLQLIITGRKGKVQDNMIRKSSPKHQKLEDISVCIIVIFFYSVTSLYIPMHTHKNNLHFFRGIFVFAFFFLEKRRKW